MSMARPLGDLKAMPYDQLVAGHDAAARNTMVGVNYYLEEIRFRDQSIVAQEVHNLTKRIFGSLYS